MVDFLILLSICWLIYLYGQWYCFKFTDDSKQSLDKKEKKKILLTPIQNVKVETAWGKFLDDIKVKSYYVVSAEPYPGKYLFDPTFEQYCDYLISNGWEPVGGVSTILFGNSWDENQHYRREQAFKKIN